MGLASRSEEESGVARRVGQESELLLLYVGWVGEALGNILCLAASGIVEIVGPSKSG